METFNTFFHTFSHIFSHHWKHQSQSQPSFTDSKTYFCEFFFPNDWQCRRVNRVGRGFRKVFQVQIRIVKGFKEKLHMKQLNGCIKLQLVKNYFKFTDTLQNLSIFLHLLYSSDHKNPHIQKLKTHFPRWGR